MTDDLMTLIKQGVKEEPIIISKPSEELVPPLKTVEPQEVMEEVAQTESEFPLVSLSAWWAEHYKLIQNIRVPTVHMLDVDSEDNIIITVPKAKEEPGRRVRVIERCLTKQVVNLPPVTFDIFDHDVFRIIHSCGNNIFIKSYTSKTGTINIFYLSYNNELIPYARERSKKNSKSVKVFSPNFRAIEEKLNQSADVQKIFLLYKQIEKQMDLIKTNMEAVTWLNSRQNGVIDVNHLILLDDVIINIVNG